MGVAGALIGAIATDCLNAGVPANVVDHLSAFLLRSSYFHSYVKAVAAKSAEMTPVQVSDAFVEVAKLHQYRYYRSHLSYERCRREQEKSLSQLASAYLRLGINVNEVKPNEICQ